MKIVLKSTWILMILCATHSFSQQTVGLFLNDPTSFQGYTLFGNNTHTYLINNCGWIVNSWISEYKPGNSIYLLENGNLLRTAQVEGAFDAGGFGGRFELFNWEGDLLWTYTYANDLVQAHHDIAPLPNGNFLAIAWEKHSETEAKVLGRKFNGAVWSEKIIEIEMNGTNEARIVWEWRLWDHLVQDQNSTLANYGVIANHPELVDINYIEEGQETSGNWIHLNAIDYNETLDQIAVSSRLFSEIWIIDHSTTTLEAASHQGGRYGKGGDLLYRYGNPQTYDRGTEEDRKFFYQHDIRWIPDGYPYGGKLMIFNNEKRNEASSVEIWSPPVDVQGNYLLEETKAFGPEELDWEYSAPGFYSRIMSGAQMLPNGNVFICEGTSGRFFEINEENALVWEYINPVNRNGFPVAQGGTVKFNQTFRATRYSPDFPAFHGRILTPIAPVELNPWDITCTTIGPVITGLEVSSSSGIYLLGNPISAEIHLTVAPQHFGSEIYVYDQLGKRVKQLRTNRKQTQIDFSNASPGLYFLKVVNDQGFIHIEKVIKK
ncbi:aryl-sulfate sulfotransferase [Fulvivirgaceae bacterium BMA10]|uniref:Aryl-sulfate sulfotransferase n=1 Tax=Splendidivirga corallicola TaxID=3051826 RepID=A0ABT8KNY2_9BACT|nr:aryl-sulfate sulfotransferase [Fulvivirgaceae bacterium BMA10]